VIREKDKCFNTFLVVRHVTIFDFAQIMVQQDYDNGVYLRKIKQNMASLQKN
jgi:hypothetical protein